MAKPINQKNQNKHKIKVVTVSMTISNGNRIVCTQNLSPNFLTGHYRGYVEDNKGNILHSFNSIGSAPGPITMPFLIEEYERLTRD